MTRSEKLSSSLYPWRKVPFLAAVVLIAWGARDFKAQLRDAGQEPLAASTVVIFGIASLVFGTFVGAYWCRVSRRDAYVLQTVGSPFRYANSSPSMLAVHCWADSASSATGRFDCSWSGRPDGILVRSCDRR